MSELRRARATAQLLHRPPAWVSTTRSAGCSPLRDRIGVVRGKLDDLALLAGSLAEPETERQARDLLAELRDELAEGPSWTPR